MTRVFVTGGSGQLGKELTPALEKTGFVVTAPSHLDFDISEGYPKLLYKLLSARPSVVIHAAALTGIPRCETFKTLAWKTNAIGTAKVRKAADAVRALFIYISTPCVFDGEYAPYEESAIPYPKNMYGVTKLIGEIETSKASRWLIIRCNFVPREKWPYPRAFKDRYGTYLFADQLSRGIVEVTQAALLNDPINTVVHIVGDKRLSMYQLAKITTPTVKPMTMKDYDGPSLTIDMSLDSVVWKKYSIEDE